MTNNNNKKKKSPIGRRKHPLPSGIALPPRHQTFGGADLMGRFVSAVSGERFVDIAEDSTTLCEWRCPAGHIYEETRAAHRHSRGCPTCATSVATRMPGLLKHWDSKKNGLSAADVSAYSQERYYWVCDHGHQFERPPYRVLATGHQCKLCRREGVTPWRIAGKRDTSTTLAAAFPAIAAQWDRELNPRGPEEFAPGSQRVAYWRCENGHSWSSPICHRTSTARHPASCQQCKAIAYSVPDLAEQLHPTLNPADIAYIVRKSSSQVLFWQCERGHIFSASVAARLRSAYPAACDKCRSITVKAPDLIDACWAYELNGKLDPEVLRTSSSQEVWWVRVDSLDVRPAKREARHFERKRIGYRFRRYINNQNREIARIAEHLAGQRRPAPAKLKRAKKLSPSV
ncbi:zinc-ribbon domain-containing protein [Congregibacter sp.]|jgi:hypothetical protein|uniref:zinc-ribbon domain-containing protein n=1 Tax=Congregibacter sp. TaxID=2744308 RepID=UPI0039E3FE63